MAAMDAQLPIKAKTQTAASAPAAKSASSSKGKGKATPTFMSIPEEGNPDLEDEDLDDLAAAMAAELKEALETGSDAEDEDGLPTETNIDYNLIKNFLQSFKAQGGLSGPVSNLAGRLEGGWGLPRDA